MCTTTKGYKGEKNEQMNAKKHIGISSLAFGLLAGIVFGILGPDKKSNKLTIKRRKQRIHPPSLLTNSHPRWDVENPQEEATPVTETTRENTLDQGGENRRLTADDAAQIAIEKTNGGIIKKVEYKRKDKLFKRKSREGGYRNKARD